MRRTEEGDGISDPTHATTCLHKTINRIEDGDTREPERLSETEDREDKVESGCDCCWVP